MGWWLTNKDGQYQNVDTGKTKDASQFSTQNGFTASNSRRIAVRKEEVRTNQNGSVVKSYNDLHTSIVNRPVEAVRSLSKRSDSPIGANITVKYVDSNNTIRYISSGYMAIYGETLNDWLTALVAKYAFSSLISFSVSVLSA